MNPVQSGPGPNTGPDAEGRIYAGRSLSDRRTERRERFRAAGLELFGTLGFPKVTISRICTEAGLSRRQFYEEYTCREDLLIEIYDAIQSQAHLDVIAAVAAVADTDLRSVARAAVGAYVGAIAADHRSIRCTFVEVGGVSEGVEAHRVASRETWAGFIADTISSVSGTTSKRRDYAATAFIGALTSVVHRWSTEDPRPDEELVIDLLADILVDLAAD